MRRYRSSIAGALALMVCVSLPTGVVHAAEGGHFGGHFEGGHLGGGPVRVPEHSIEHRGHYEPEHRSDEGWRWGGRGFDAERWHGGRWFHGEHVGRLGWWWVAGDSWYFYPAPVYPYPDPYIPPAVVAPSAGYSYYCTSANAYYPYVTACPEGWKPISPQS